MDIQDVGEASARCLLFSSELRGDQSRRRALLSLGQPATVDGIHLARACSTSIWDGSGRIATWCPSRRSLSERVVRTPFVPRSRSPSTTDTPTIASTRCPLLARWNLPATFFVTAGLLDRDPLVLERFGSFDALGPDGIRPLDWNDLSEMLAAGMEVGAHTYSHANLARCDPESLKREVALSKTVIEQRLGVPVSSMAYPFGLRRAHFDDRVIEAVRQAGYLSAASVLYRGVRSIDLPYEIPRFFTKRDDLDVLRLKVLGGFDVVALWQRSTPLSLGRLLSPDYFGSGERAKAKG